MFLECKRTNVTVPRSSDITLIFPFDQFLYRFKRQNYNPLTLDTKRYSPEKINEVIDTIEQKCDNFRRVRKFRNLAILSTVIFALGIILGNILLNIGIDKSSHSEVEFVKFEGNNFMIGGGILLVAGVIQFIFVMCSLAYKTRKLRVTYEDNAKEIIDLVNQKSKENGVRWKMGQFFNWIELSLDYKVEGNLLTSTKGFNTMLLPSKTRSDNYV